MDYLRYWTPVAVVAATLAGFLVGGNGMWTGIASLPVLTLLDVLAGADRRERATGNSLVATLPVWICAIVPVLLYPVFAWKLSTAELTPLQILGGVLSLGWMGVIPLVPAAHELYHMRGALPRTVGRYAHLCILDCTRDIGHVVGHHIDVATVNDSDTAARGTNLYAFTAQALLRSTKFAFRAEANALRKRGMSPWNLRHRGYRAGLALLVFLTALYAIGGWPGVALSFCGMLLARCWVESFNYFQHYGLVRVPGAPIGRRHVWNHFGWFSRVMTFEITNHADHHLNSYQAFYTFVPHREAIPMPSVFLCFLSALIPPLWHEMIVKPALRRWDLEYANADERRLAAEQNRAAGWANWQQEPGVEVGKAATVGV